MFAVATVGVLAVGAAVHERRTFHRRLHERRGFRVRVDTALCAELDRIVTAQLDTAMRALENPRRDSSGALHDARTSIKRVRTVLRLARDQIGADRYREVNDTLRCAGQLLAALRDAIVLPAVLEELARGSIDEIDGRELIELRETLAGGGRAAAHLDPGQEPLVGAILRLRRVRSQLEERPLVRDDVGVEAIVGGLRRVYKRGRRSFREVLRHRDTDALHAWRKRVKDLRYGAELLRDADPHRLKQIRHAAHELSDLLGDDHDLAMLDQRAKCYPSITRVIDCRREELQRAAFELAEAAYAAPPRRFAKQLRRRARKHAYRAGN
jgi:CHAD domain-containing protein